MKNILFLTLAISFLFVSCVQKGHAPLLTSLGRATSGIQINAVSVSNNQLIIHGTGFSQITNIALKNTSLVFNESFAIESKSDTQIIANGLNNLSIVSNALFDLILSSAEASSTYTISFSVANGSIVAAMLSSMGAVNGQVLKFSGGVWAPASLPNSQTYMGTWDANSDTPLLASTSPISGDYYIVSTAGSYNAVAFGVGDWVMYNGSSWDKISTDISTKLSLGGGTLTGDLLINTQEKFKGGASYVTLKASAALATNISLTLPVSTGTIGQVLSTDGTGVMSWMTPSTGGVTSVNTQTGAVVLSTTNIAEGTNLYHTDARTITAPITAPTLTNSTIATGDTIQVALGKVQAQINNLLSSVLTGLSTATNSVVTTTDSILAAFGKVQAQITSLGSTKLDKTGGTLSIGTINGVPNPNNADDVANKQYVDSFGLWQKGTNPADVVRASGNVGIGTTTPLQKLEVVGNLKTTGQVFTNSFSVSSNAIDWDTGNAGTTSDDCATAVSMSNLRDGGTYTLVVTGTGTTQCNFSTSVPITGAGIDTVAYRFRPLNGPRYGVTHSLYTFTRVGTVVYVSWSSGF